jgi:predicted ester cyclase
VGTRENKALIQQLYEKGLLGGREALDRYFAKDYVDHSAWGDLDGLKATLEAFTRAYPNAEWKVEDMLAEGEKVAVRATLEVKTAAGVSRSIGSTSIYRIANGRIAEQWSHGDPIF